MRKIHSQFENPIDDILISLCEPVSIWLHENTNTTPNIITTIGVFFGALAIYNLLEKRYIHAFIFYWISYYIDCLDGYYARKYDMVTIFGGYYDFIRDIIVNLSLVGIIFTEIKSEKSRLFFTVVMIMSYFLMLIHMGCQERMYNDDTSAIGILKHLCRHETDIHHTKYVGCGTIVLITSLFILYHKNIDNFLNHF